MACRLPPPKEPYLSREKNPAEDTPKEGLEGFFLLLCLIQYRSYHLIADTNKLELLVTSSQESTSEKKQLRSEIGSKRAEILKLLGDMQKLWFKAEGKKTCHSSVWASMGDAVLYTDNLLSVHSAYVYKLDDKAVD